MVSISRSMRPLLRLRLLPSCIPRRYATSSSTSAVKVPKRAPQIPAAKSTSVPRQPYEPQGARASNDLPPEKLHKQWYATKLYNAGQRAIYRPPSHAGILAASYIITASALVTAGALAFSNLWAYDTSSDLPWIVRVAWRAGIITFTFVAGFAFLRPTRLIRSIDLVSKDGVVKLAVQVRRPLPFLRPKEYIIAPYEFEMDRKFVQQMDEPDFMHDDKQDAQNAVSKLGRVVSKAIYYPFAATRRLLTLEGMMSVHLNEHDSPAKLDTQGKFSNAAKDLVEMGTIKI
ncbi:hypothetical protein A1O1_08367 [Capronia coronata CBS 617.96]|uniref:Uncharacterized protein n=1 Tax=Capronia coronata CBS 617.96 TaxID=1182541 RepID=W9XSA2_9EURO|nr:uncharacterized protein A1O1_08367 [Capronia coronata CBS 617.96]EXJ80225.1 hypothetical protein A1O1_08367 [Capronia coronata CBS 617.96]